MTSLIKGVARGMRKVGVAFLSLSVLVVGAAVFEATTARDGARTASDGWGGESLAAVHEGGGFSLIGVANACGLGASSCFKCHNGTRAAAANEDPVAAPWHADHRTVNNSCAGCHNGNPRIIREEMAHKNLIADPRTQPKQGCTSCHAADTDEKVARYLGVMGGGK